MGLMSPILAASSTKRSIFLWLFEMKTASMRL